MVLEAALVPAAEVVASTITVVASANRVDDEVGDGGARVVDGVTWGGNVAVGVKLPANTGRSRAEGREKFTIPAISGLTISSVVL